MNQNMLKNNKILKAQDGNKTPAIDEDGIFSIENNTIPQLMYTRVDRIQSPREWILDPSFAKDAYFTPDMIVTGKGAKNYQRALNKVSNFKLKVDPRTQEDYQRDMYFGKFNSNEIERLSYLNNALDAAWNNERLKYQNGNISNAKFSRMQKKYIEQKNIINENLRNITNAANKLQTNAQWMNDFNRLGKGWGVGFTGAMLGIPAISTLGAAAVASAPYVAEAIPTIAKGVGKVILDPRTWAAMLGGEAANEGVRQISNDKYQSVGDYVYKTSGLKHLVDGTWAEDPARYVAEMVNPAYYLPYNKLANVTGSLIDNGIRSIQKAGFFTPSEGIPADALGMNLFRKKLPEIYPLKGYDAQAGSQYSYAWMTPDEYSKSIQSGTKLNTKIFDYPEIYVDKATGKVNISASKARWKSNTNNINNSSLTEVKKSWMTPKDYSEKYPVGNKKIFRYPELLVDEHGNIDLISTKNRWKYNKSNSEPSSKWYKKTWPWVVGTGAATAIGYGIYSSQKNKPEEKPTLDGNIETIVTEAVNATGAPNNLSNYNQSNTEYYDYDDLDF